jgi:hypothetical protein
LLIGRHKHESARNAADLIYILIQCADKSLSISA